MLPIVFENLQVYVPPSDLCRSLISTSVLSDEMVTRDDDRTSLLSFVQKPVGSGVPETLQYNVMVFPCCCLYLLGVLSVIFGGAGRRRN